MSFLKCKCDSVTPLTASHSKEKAKVHGITYKTFPNEALINLFNNLFRVSYTLIICKLQPFPKYSNTPWSISGFGKLWLHESFPVDLTATIISLQTVNFTR